MTDAIAQPSSPRPGGLAQMIPLIATKRFSFIVTVLSGIVAQVSTVVALGTGAWLVGGAVRGATTDDLVGAFWILGAAVFAAAACKWWQTFISHDFVSTPE